MLAANFKLPAKNIVVSIGPVSVTRIKTETGADLTEGGSMGIVPKA